MILNSIKRYVVIKVINDIISTYGSLDRKSIDDYIYHDNHEENFYHDISYSLHSGASKLCIDFSDFDWVVKIPIAYDICSNEKFSLFARVRDDKYGDYLHVIRDLCAEEVAIYQDAVDRGIEQFFLEEKRVMFYKGIPIYVQKRVKDIYCDVVDSDEDEEDIFDAEEVYNEIEDLKLSSDMDDLLDLTNFVVDLYNHSTSSQFADLLVFLDDNSINDLHNENVGYDKYNNPVIFDYSGYHRRSWAAQ